METVKQTFAEIKKKINQALEDGDIFAANEIQANVMVGTTIMTMVMLGIVCLVLNELGLFSADKIRMRWAVAIMLAIAMPIQFYNKKVRGEGKYLRVLMGWGILAVCEIMCALLGHNVVLIMCIPVLLSTRYCHANFTRIIAVYSIVFFTIAEISNAFIGITNLNIVKLEPGTILTITTTLRDAIENMDIDRKAYLISMLKNDFLPKFIIFSVVGSSCSSIAQNGRDMIDNQQAISEKGSRIATELNLATQIQVDMLPCIFPAFPDHNELELYAVNRPAKEVGGDFYDYFVVDEDHVAMVMADVSGKGVGAALFMTISKIVLKNQMLVLKDPAKALAETNRQLCETNKAGLFVTIWTGLYEISTGKLVYTNAGHNEPIIHKVGEPCRYLTGKNGMVCAAFDMSKYTTSEIYLNVGDEIFLYTDGVTESTSVNDELFGEDRLLECMNGDVDKSVKDQIDDVMAHLDEFATGRDQFDDITMLGMRVLPKKA